MKDSVSSLSNTLRQFIFHNTTNLVVRDMNKNDLL